MENNTEIVIDEKDINISKATLKDLKFLVLEYSVPHKNLDHVQRTEKPSHMVHDDMVNAFAKFEFHLALIAEQVELIKFKNIGTSLETKITEPNIFDYSEQQQQIIKRIAVTSVGLKSGDAGVILNGSRILSDERVLQLSSGINYGDGYYFDSELSEAVEHLVYEIKQFIFEGKKAPEAIVSDENKVILPALDFDNESELTGNTPTVTFTVTPGGKIGKEKKKKKNPDTREMDENE